MHGVKREYDAEKLETKRKEDEKRIQDFCQGLAKADEARSLLLQEPSRAQAQSLLKLSEAVLLMNPSHYTMWNARKDALKTIGFDEAETLAIELKLSTKCLMLAPKSYCVWEHRRWCIELTRASIDSELALCEKFHSYDPRNFHCWNYRRWLMDLQDCDTAPQVDADYTLKKIQENFSNYSAWHQRSVVFNVESDDFNREFDLIFNGIFTSPGDQSLWMYAYWLMAQTKDLGLVYSLGSHCVELYELEGEAGSKWPLLTLLKIGQMHNFEAFCGDKSMPVPTVKGMDRGQLIEALIRVDPMRRGYYKSLK